MERHRDDATAFVHQRRRRARKLRQGICAYLQARQKRIAIRFQVIAFQRFARRKGDAVNQKIQSFELSADLLKCLVNFFLLRYVASD